LIKNGLPSTAKKRTGDLLVKTRFRGEAAGFLIHLEHQAQHDPSLGRRMLQYFMLDWCEYDLPVYPIAVLSHKRASAASLSPLVVSFPNKKVMEFNFDVIDLPRMDADSFVKMPNPAALALAARMKSDAQQRISLTEDFFVTLSGIPMAEREQRLIASFFSSYQPLNRCEALQLQKKLDIVKPDAVREKVMDLTNPFIELGKEEGLQQGRQQGEVELVLKLLSRRLGPLSSAQEKAVRKLPIPKIEALGEALLDFSSRTDLARWLRTHA
jgi:hypothetical protein